VKEYIADGLMLGTFGLGCVIAGSYASEHDLLMSLAYLAFAGLIAVQIFRELQESHAPPVLGLAGRGPYPAQVVQRWRCAGRRVRLAGRGR
jgi:hypothetical protein